MAVHQASAVDLRTLLLSTGVNTEQEVERGFTPLLLAAQDGRVECIAEVNVTL